MLLWDTANHTPLASLSAGSAVYSVAFSPDGRTLAVATKSGTVRLFPGEQLWPNFVRCEARYAESYPAVSRRRRGARTHQASGTATPARQVSKVLTVARLRMEAPRRTSARQPTGPASVAARASRPPAPTVSECAASAHVRARD